MSAVKAALRVVLYAEQVVVAESNDAQLWQRVLATINGNTGSLGKTKMLEDEIEDEADREESVKPRGSAKGPLAEFATDIGVKTEELQAACDPSVAEPYLTLDHDAWEAFKKQLGDRGPQAVSPAAAAATLLALWFKFSNRSTNATQAQAQVVLKTIGVRDTNAARGIKHSEWLQPRAGGQTILNPAKITKARRFAKCFCTHDWSEWKSAN